MNKIFILGIVVIGVNLYAFEYTKVTSRIESIGLFKNGLAYVTQSVELEGKGPFMIANAPKPVYGTFWVESDNNIEACVKNVPQEEELKNDHDIQALFGGKDVVLHYNNKEIKGLILPAECQSESKQWKQNYGQSYRYSSFSSPPNLNIPQTRFLKVKTEKGIVFLNKNSVTYIECQDYNKTKQVYKPALIFKLKNSESGKVKVSFSYLTKGISWAASYLVNLDDNKELAIEQKAVIKNEWQDFENAKISLISGFPNVKFAQVTSPLSLESSWSTFFRQLNQHEMQASSVMSNVIRQQAYSPQQAITPMLPDSFSEGVDIYYNNIGVVTMKAGEALALSVEKKRASYEAIVSWNIPDNRKANGRYVDSYEIRNNKAKFQSEVWDSIIFKNPFKFPMTTAAVTFIKNSQFLGESISCWVNPGAEAVININKALSISTRSTEKEVIGKRKRLKVYGDSYQKTEVQGTLKIKNYRKDAVKMLVKRRFSGELLSADDNPKCELHEAGVYSINKRNELIWEISLKPGQEKTINYKYEVLVDI